MLLQFGVCGHLARVEGGTPSIPAGIGPKTKSVATGCVTSRRWQPESLAWLPRKPEPSVAPDADPHVIPPLTVDPASIVVLAFGGWRRGSDQVDPQTRGDEDRQQRLQEVAREHDLIHGEVFRLLGTNTEGEFLGILEFPQLAGAEAYIETEKAPPAGSYHKRNYHLARRWAPEYFATWPPRTGE